MALLSAPASAHGTIVQGGLQQQSGSSYCEAGFEWLASHRGPAAPDHAMLYRLCAAGDSIMIPSTFASVIAKACALSQAVVSTPDNLVICVVGPQRRVRDRR